ncbi:helix-turn-helix transcriptional regulator [Nocardia cyriacigeorgica]|uniref:Helix-turn-helix transcriptional regulator n=1 Tax=Nocardia cyriacigeorgica TaxID=135487 RepID=A0A6P1D9I6_9NOCA|nr:helix-turn-helix transcriptional regulator [Nocardia cyriacigeorgica]NEW44942.1 helix-turn-helix transcriptional regulator [Nocardia cyriacigeorgica]
MDRSELAALLRQARARIRPDDVGLPAGARRHVPGLRREEVAQLAGVSVDYVVRLEQGRGPRPSTSVLAALARALRLHDDDRDLLFRFAGSEPPGADRIAMVVRASVLRLVLDRMVDLPALVLSAKSDVLAWNPMAAALLGDFSRWPVARRNIIWHAFLGDGPHRVVMTPEDRDALSATWVASLHAARARYPADPGLDRLITELRTGSPRFERLWDERRAGYMRNTRKTIDHPDLGRLTLDCDTLLVPDADQTVVVYSAAPGTPEAGALELLRVTGTEQFTNLGA